MDVIVRGTAETAARLRALPVELAKGAIGRAVLAGGRLIAADAAARAPVGRTGKLRRSIRARLVEQDQAHAKVLVGSRRVPYAHLVEFGHRLVRGGRVRKGGQVVGIVPPHPFLRPAFDERAQEAVDRMAAVLRQEVEAAVKALGGTP